MAYLHNLSEFTQFDTVNNRHKYLRSLHEVDMQSNGSNSMVNYYPEINLQSDISNPPSQKIPCLDISTRNLLIPVSKSVLKRVAHIFFEDGLRSALNEARSEQAVNQMPILSKGATWVVRLLDFYEDLKIIVFPYAQKLNAENIAKFVETRDWINSRIRYINWHPNFYKLAVAGSDDIIRIYGQNPNVFSVLKCSGQKEISCLAWRPFSPGEIVVGCKAGLYHWTTEGNVNITRSIWQKQVHKHPSKLPVTSLQWNKNGSLLATASVGDRMIVIWDLDSLKTLAVKRIGPPCSLLKWSPHGTWLFTATVGKMFRVWDCNNRWDPERWVINEGTIQSACWSPCETFLVFVTTSKPILYRLEFGSSSLFAAGTDSKDVLAIADLSEYTVGNTVIGGKPQQTIWDPNGQFIVITFKHTNSIVIFRTLIQKYDLKLSAESYISGQSSSEYPNFVTFQSIHLKNQKTVLTIGWSSGRIQYCPLQ